MNISSNLFEAFLKCPTKCWLRATGELGSGNDYAEWVKSQATSYRATETERLLSETLTDESAVAPVPANLKTAKWRLAVDVVAQTSTPAGSGSVSLPGRTPGGTPGQPADETSALPARPEQGLIETRLHAVERIPSAGRGQPAQFVPIRFIYRNKLTKDDRLLLAFDAFVLSEMLGRAINLGKIIHGDDHATLKVKTSALAGEVRKRIGKMTELLANSAPPDLVLNRHCAECEFQARCRKIAVEKDDLSLLAGMSAKERQKLRSKGIFTVTQLSYTFRPRRRPKRMRDKREKYHHSLKALAIREKKIHIVGSPELKIDGTPVYLDVEGLPDRDFYYLIGLRIGNGDSAVQHSLWADTVADEGKIWREFLAILETVEKPVLIHYGSYETTFLKAMMECYGKPRDDSAAAKAMGSAINLISFVFARVYFPTYSNGLKEIAGWLGARWSEANPSGATAIAFRHRWEKDRDDSARSWLIDYNCRDSAALELISTTLALLVRKPDMFSDADLVGVPKTPSTQRGKQLHQCLKSVLKSAQLIYARKKISFHPGGNQNLDEGGNKSTQKTYQLQRLPSRGGKIIRVARKRKCPYHLGHPSVLRKSKREAEHALLDIAYTKCGCKKVLVRYVGRGAFCPHCHTTHSPPAIQRFHRQIFGAGFHVWAVYLRIALRLSVRLISKVTRDLLHVNIQTQTIMQFVEKTFKDHRQTEEALLRAILKSNSIHVDETKINILGVQQYVWVLTDGIHVVFFLTPGRETGFLHDLLAQYNGTIVSDFYGGYDALPCRQQKCLVHLIRDLNDDLWKNPFDEEYEKFVLAVRNLIVPIIEDIQRYGLKTFHLRKHLHCVEHFYNRSISGFESNNDLILKYKKRFERYRDSMFTFLMHDGVSWNNNVAERAIRHLAVQRKISGAFTTKGANHYLRLLAIAQTCRFQDKSFLGFLLSGLKNVDAYKDTHRRPRR